MSLRESSPLQDLKVPLAWTAAVAVILAAVIGLALVFGDRRETVQGHAITQARDAFDRVAQPVSGVLSAPVRWVGDGVNGVKQYFFAISENRRLHAQITELQQWREKAIAAQYDNQRYQALLGLKTDPPIPMVGARVIADSRGPFSQTRLADAGAEAGIGVGNPVMNERGLVGHVISVAKGVSRVLLLTDVSSRTPVVDQRTDARAILTGDGSDSPTLEYLRGAEPVKAGDRILTSGDGGLFPRGLPVGVVYQGWDGQWRVRLDAQDAPMDMVRILQFKDFSQLAQQRQLQQLPMPALTPQDQARVAAQVAAASASSQPPAQRSASSAAPAGHAQSSTPPKHTVAQSSAPPKHTVAQSSTPPRHAAAQSSTPPHHAAATSGAPPAGDDQ